MNYRFQTLLFVCFTFLLGCARGEDAASGLMASTPAGLLTSGQIVRFTEDRAAKLAAPAWPKNQYSVAGGAPGVIAWSGGNCYDIIRGCDRREWRDPAFGGIKPDVTARAGAAKGPIWTKTAANTMAFNMWGTTTIFPHDAIPAGRWQITAKMLYSLIPAYLEGCAPHDCPAYRGSARVGIACRYTNPRGKRRSQSLPGGDAIVHYPTEGSVWISGVVNMISGSIDLAECKAKSADSYVEIEFGGHGLKGFQFNSLEVSMAGIL